MCHNLHYFAESKVFYPVRMNIHLVITICELVIDWNAILKCIGTVIFLSSMAESTKRAQPPSLPLKHRLSRRGRSISASATTASAFCGGKFGPRTPHPYTSSNQLLINFEVRCLKYGQNHIKLKVFLRSKKMELH